MQAQHLKELTLKDIADYDGGRIGEAVQQALKRTALDCEDRAADSRPRKISIELVFVPECDDRGLCEDVHFQAQIKDSTPPRKTKVYSLGIRMEENGNARLMFSPGDPENHRQPGLPLGDPAENAIDRTEEED